MTRDEYLTVRAQLGQQLRDVREERKMLRSMFTGTRAPDLISAYLDWGQRLVDLDVRLSGIIVRLDKEWANGEFDQIVDR